MFNLKMKVMKKLKIFIVLVSLIMSSEILAQQEQYVFIQMYQVSTKGGGGFQEPQYSL